MNYLSSFFGRGVKGYDGLNRCGAEVIANVLPRARDVYLLIYVTL